MRLTGSILKGTPYLAGEVTPAGELAFGPGRHPDQDKVLAFVLDTGFDGCLALPEKLINRLDADHVGFEQFTMADNQPWEVPVYLVPIVVGQTRLLSPVIVAQPLIGMEFLIQWAARVELDLQRSSLSVLLR